jgi:hypothetical protein
MSLHPHDDWTIPAGTAQVARAIFPHGSPYLAFRDTVGSIYCEVDLILPTSSRAVVNQRRHQPASHSC